MRRFARFFPASAVFVILSGCFCSPRVDAQETYTEATVPAPVLLKPGTTVITGGITDAGGTDTFHVRGTTGGTVTVRLRYTHGTANLLTGVPEKAHLGAQLSVGKFSPPSSFFVDSSVPGVSLSSNFLLQNGVNSISAASFPVLSYDDAVRVLVSAPANKTNPAYTLEVEYFPPKDSWETAGNETAAAAVVLDPSRPGTRSGTIHSPAEEDWFRFAVPEGETLFLYVVSNGVTPVQRLLTELRTPGGVVLQAAQSQTATLLETAGPGGREYLLRIRSADGYAQGWLVFWRLEDRFEPNNSANTASHLGTLVPGGRLEVGGLTAGVTDSDSFSFTTSLPAGTPILIAAPDDPSLEAGFLPTIGLVDGITTEVRSGRGYSVITAPAGGTVKFQTVGSERVYRLRIKAESPYDLWHHEQTGPGMAIATYIPPESDYDHDGVPALLEWALRGSLTQRDTTGVSAPFFDGNSWRVNVALPAGGPIAPVRVRESVDLQAWTDIPAIRTNLGGSVIPTGRTATAVLTLTRPGEARNWIRLQVEE